MLEFLDSAYILIFLEESLIINFVGLSYLVSFLYLYFNQSIFCLYLLNFNLRCLCWIIEVNRFPLLHTKLSTFSFIVQIWPSALYLKYSLFWLQEYLCHWLTVSQNLMCFFSCLFFILFLKKTVLCFKVRGLKEFNTLPTGHHMKQHKKKTFFTDLTFNWVKKRLS